MSGRILPVCPAGKALTGATAAPSLAELVELVGAEAAQKLCEAFGGTNRTIGKPADCIVAAVGMEAAVMLRSYFGGERIYIPRQTRSIEARYADIARLRREGVTVQRIALSAQLSERQVYSVLARLKAKGQVRPQSRAALCGA